MHQSLRVSQRDYHTLLELRDDCRVFKQTCRYTSVCTTRAVAQSSSLFLHLMLVKTLLLTFVAPPRLSFPGHLSTLVASGGCGGSKCWGKRGKGEETALPLDSHCASAGAFLVGCSPQASPAVLTHEQWRVMCVPHSAAPVATTRRMCPSFVL